MDLLAERKELGADDRKKERVEGAGSNKAAAGEQEKKEARDLLNGDWSGTAANESRQQLSMFYNGKVCVFDSISPEKAHAIMLIAAATAAATRAVASSGTSTPLVAKAPAASGSDSPTAAVSPVLTRSPSVLSSSARSVAAAPPQALLQPDQRPQPQPQLSLNVTNSFCKLQAELPIARRHSLQRFLEKRRDRLVNQTPYTMSKEISTIGLGSEPSSPLSHSDEATKSR